MPLTRAAGVPHLPAVPQIVVQMDEWKTAVGDNALITKGVADCLVMILHAPRYERGSLAHLSWPKQAQGHPNASHELAIARNTATIRDAMVSSLECEPQYIEVYLWRGFGFGPTSGLGDDGGNILDVIAHPGSNSSFTGDFGDSTNWTARGTEAPFAFAVLTTERNAA